jgi:hypothetical protein
MEAALLEAISTQGQRSSISISGTAGFPGACDEAAGLPELFAEGNAGAAFVLMIFVGVSTTFDGPLEVVTVRLLLSDSPGLNPVGGFAIAVQVTEVAF